MTERQILALIRELDLTTTPARCLREQLAETGDVDLAIEAALLLQEAEDALTL